MRVCSIVQFYVSEGGKMNLSVDSKQPNQETENNVCKAIQFFFWSVPFVCIVRRFEAAETNPDGDRPLKRHRRHQHVMLQHVRTCL